MSRRQTGWLEESLSYETLCGKFEDYGQNGRVGGEMTEYITEILCPFIANFVNTFDMDKVVIGGQLMVDGGETLLKAIRKSMESLTLSEVAIEGCVTEYTGVVGSALMASNQLCNTVL